MIGIKAKTGITPKRNKSIDQVFDKMTSPWDPKDPEPPNKIWKDHAKEILLNSMENIWNSKAEHIRHWLQEERCLDEESMHQFYLGYLSKDQYFDRESWGLGPERDAQGKLKKIWVPAGIVIPLFKGVELCRLRIRRLNALAGKKYIFIPGGSAAPMVLKNKLKVTMIVESEFDAMLINQEAGDIVNIIALGTVSMRPDTEADELLKSSREILVALDTGEENSAGAKEAWSWWMRNYPTALRCPILYGKDPTEAAHAGLNLRDWIIAALAGGAVRMTG